jgi:type VI secretion system secreted protein VgrG
MNITSAFVNFLVAHRDLVTTERPLRLRVDHPSMMMEDVLLPQRVDGHETFCGGFEYRVQCVALDANLPLKEFIALPAAIDIVTDRGKLRSVCGVVTEAWAGDSDGGLASYQLVIRDVLAVLEKRINTRVFRNLSEPEIVQGMLREWLRKNPVLGTVINVETDNIFDNMQYPKREFTMQHNESDAAFIRRLLKRRGIAWFFRPDATQKNPAHRMCLLNRYESVLQNAAGTVRYHRDASTEERDSITAWNAVRTLQPSSVARHSWDYRTPLASDLMRMRTEREARQGPKEHRLGAVLDDYQVLAPHAGDSPADFRAVGSLAMKRHDFETKCFTGEGSVRDFRVGEYFALAGHPEIDRHQDIDREFVITELHIAVQNNLPRDLCDRVARLFARSGWPKDDLDTRPVKMRFTAVRRGIALVPAYDPRMDLPPVHMQSAIVVGPENEEVHCDAAGRVKIRFPATREEDHASGGGASSRDHDSAWVRVVTSWAGNGPGHDQCGSLSLPRVGSEVLVSFLGGDTDKPVIVGQMYNHHATPPALSKAGALPGNRYLSGIRSREVKGSRRGNQLRFDDTKGQISAQLASDHGDSQLNLGFLTQPRQNGWSEPRGEGVELRTQEQIALRAAKGLLLTAWRAINGDDKQLARTELLNLLKDCQELTATLGNAACRQKGLAVDTRPLEELDKAVRQWEGGTNTQPKQQGGDPVIAVSSPGGISLATSKAASTYAGTNADIAAQLNVQFSAGQRFIANSGKGVSLYAHSGGITAISQQGNVLLQSQHGKADINAAKDLTLTSSEGKLSCMAKEILLVAEDGSFIKIGRGITLGTNGKITHHGTDFPFDDPKTASAALPKFGNDATRMRVAVKYELGTSRETPAGNRNVKIERDDGQVVETKADEQGLTENFTGDVMHQVSITELGLADEGGES